MRLSLSFVALLPFLLSGINVYSNGDSLLIPKEYMFVMPQPNGFVMQIGHVNEKDTVRDFKIEGKWVYISIPGKIKGYVKQREVKFISSGQIKAASIPKDINSFLDKYANWKRWYFWAIATGLVIVLIGLGVLIGNLSEKLGITDKLTKFNLFGWSPMIIGVLFGFLFLFWREKFLGIIITKISFVPPMGGSILEWLIWGGLAFLVFAFILDTIIYLFRLTLFQTSINLLFTLLFGFMFFITAIYISIALSVIGLIIMAIWAGSIVLFSSSDNKQKNKPEGTKKEMQGTISQENERMHQYHQNKHKDPFN
jgi:hypothetical protein